MLHVKMLVIIRLVTVTVEENQINTPTCSLGAFIRQLKPSVTLIPIKTILFQSWTIYDPSTPKSWMIETSKARARKTRLTSARLTEWIAEICLVTLKSTMTFLPLQKTTRLRKWKPVLIIFKNCFTPYADLSCWYFTPQKSSSNVPRNAKLSIFMKSTPEHFLNGSHAISL